MDRHVVPRLEGEAESARHWRHPAVAGVDLLRARFVDHVFTRHAHEGYVIGVVERGVESFAYRGETHHAPGGSLVLVNPGEIHDGFAGVPDGWSYRTSYPGIELLADIASELSPRRGTVSFPDPVVHDPQTAAMFVAAHRAAEQADQLATSSLLRVAYGRVLRRHGDLSGPRDSRGLLAAEVAQARELLHERLVDPPTLEQLAETVGMRPFALLRAFRAELGLPPHAYLNQVRLRSAKRLLDDNQPPADVAALVGFADQAHLSRHFKRVYGVPPGAYRRERKNVQELLGRFS
jgi:AraC-like DNA-binding protein